MEMSERLLINNPTMSKKATKYPNGYLPKIAYHLVRGNRDKVSYFIRRQGEQYNGQGLDQQTMLPFIMDAIEDASARRPLAQMLAVQTFFQATPEKDSLNNTEPLTPFHYEFDEDGNVKSATYRITFTREFK